MRVDTRTSIDRFEEVRLLQELRLSEAEHRRRSATRRDGVAKRSRATGTRLAARVGRLLARRGRGLPLAGPAVEDGCGEVNTVRTAWTR